VIKTVDIRFSDETMQTIYSLIGQQFDGMKHDLFIHVPSVYGIVDMLIGGNAFKLTNLIEVLDYYGQMKDVAVFRFEPTTPDDIKTFMDNGKMIDFPVRSRIKEIRVVNENQKLFHNEKQAYDVYTVRGLIFVLEDGHEISFKKPIWFSEEIYIQKGYNLIEEFSPIDEFGEGWEGDYRRECSCEVISVK
jgi:hypothetical protein